MLKHLFIAATYLMLAAAVVLIFPGVVPGAAPWAGWIAGSVVAIGGALGHETYVRADQMLSLEATIRAQRAEISAMRGESDGLHNLMAGIMDDVKILVDGREDKSQEAIDRVVGEVRVLQNLIEKLSSATAPRPAANSNANANSNTKTAPSKDAPSVRSSLEDTEILDIVREGLRQDRVDLYLQPVVSLPQRKPRYYECFSRIRDESGALIMPDQYINVAKEDGLIGAIDNMLLFRCVQLVRRAQSESHDVGFFCNISANTLEDKSFFSDFVEFMGMNRELAENLYFEFSQADVDTHGKEIEEYISRLGQFGFRFSLDQISDLSKLDFRNLRRRRFKFVKINAANLLASSSAIAKAGAQGGAGTETVVGINVPILKRAMDVNNIELIVEKLESEQDLLELLDHQIELGQGYLFGEPRISRQS